jgi:hypothetical protein
MRIPLSDTTLNMTVYYPDSPHIKERSLAIVGGYQSAAMVILIVRSHVRLDVPPDDHLFEPINKTKGRFIPPEYWLYPEEGDFEKFAALKDNTQFRLGGLVWRKLAIQELDRRFAAMRVAAAHDALYKGRLLSPLNRAFLAAGEAFEKNPLKQFKSSQVNFTIQYGQYYRPRNKCFVMTAYTDGKIVFVMYRIRPALDAMARLVAPNNVVIYGDEDPNRLIRDRWVWLLEMPARQQFELNGRTWTKLTPEEVSPMVAGKVFKMLPPAHTNYMADDLTA